VFEVQCDPSLGVTQTSVLNSQVILIDSCHNTVNKATGHAIAHYTNEQQHTGWLRIDWTIQPINRVYENLHKITPSTLVVHRQIRRQKRKVHLNILR